MTGPTRAEVERRALAILELLADDPGNRTLQAELLAHEDPAVIERVRSITSMSVGIDAMPTSLPNGTSETWSDPPSRFGPFRIVAMIGRGGMGEVWRGERDDGLFEQVVAIKLIQSHLQVRAGDAFDGERRILAGLEHPNIARLIDGGTTADRRACLIMEYIDGVPFDAGCETVPLDRRIALFRQVLGAVGYAHGRLIAHGDLKPSNILVDRDGRVRLLDFGIARLVTDEANAFRLTGAVTSSFASPARLRGEPPSIPDDVFALGRLLTPVIGDAPDPQLIAIAAKACANEEARRYTSVPELITDLDRWAARFPVSAMPRTARYVASRYVRRNWLVVTAFAVLIALTTFAIIGFVRAETERRMADARFVQTRAMANYMLFDLYDALSKIPRTVIARARIVSVSQRHLNALNAEPGPGADVAIDLAGSYARLAEVQGDFGNSNMGRSRLAQANLIRADAILSDLLARDRRAATAIELAKVRIRRARSMIYGDHHPARALPLYDSIEGLLRRPGSLVDLPTRDTLWQARIGRGDALTWLNRTDESLALLRSELAHALARHSGKPQDDEFANRYSLNLRMIGEADYYAHQPAAAILAFQQAAAILKYHYGDDPVQPRIRIQMANIAQTLGTTQVEQGQVAPGVATLRQGYVLITTLSERDPEDVEALRRVLSYGGDLAIGLTRLGLTSEADHIVGRTRAGYLAQVKRFPDDAALYRAYARSIRAGAVLKLHEGRSEEACALLREADQAWRTFDTKWGITPSDRGDEVAAVNHDFAACQRRGEVVGHIASSL